MGVWLKGISSIPHLTFFFGTKKKVENLSFLARSSTSGGRSRPARALETSGNHFLFVGSWVPRTPPLIWHHYKRSARIQESVAITVYSLPKTSPVTVGNVWRETDYGRTDGCSAVRSSLSAEIHPLSLVGTIFDNYYAISFDWKCRITDALGIYGGYQKLLDINIFDRKHDCLAI